MKPPGPVAKYADAVSNAITTSAFTAGSLGLPSPQEVHLKRSQRTYTPELRAEVLALVKGGAPIKRIARERKIPDASIRWWRDHPESAASVEVRLKAETDIVIRTRNALSITTCGSMR